jgi:hypothetical protein
MRVIDMMPGEKIINPGVGYATFIAQIPHPAYPGLQLVIWTLWDGTHSFDALSPIQDVGRAMPQSPADRIRSLSAALGIG